MVEQLDLSDYNLRFVSGIWYPTTSANYSSNLKRFYNIVCEIYCQNTDLREAYYKSPNFDVAINPTDISKGTPDLLIRDNFGIASRAVEFKCSLFNFDVTEKEKLEAKIKSKYQIPTEVVFIVANESFMSTISDSNQKRLYFKLMKELRSVLSKIPKLTLLEYFKISQVTPMLEEILSKHEKVQSISDNEFEHEKYQDVEEMIPEILKQFRVMETFANKNFLATMDMSDYMKKQEKPTVHLMSPWNKSMNRNLSSLTGVEFPKGFRANYMYHCVPNKYVVESTLSELADNLYDICPTQNFAINLRDGCKIYDICSEELKDIKNMINDKAYLKTEANVEELQRIANMYGTNSSRVHDVIEIKIKGKIDSISKKIGRDVNLSKHGNPILKLDEETRNVFGIGKDSSNETNGYTLLEYGDWFGINARDEKLSKMTKEREDQKKMDEFVKAEKIIPQTAKTYLDALLDELSGVTKIPGSNSTENMKSAELNLNTTNDFLMDHFVARNCKLPDYSNAYPTNDGLNNLSNELSTIGKETLSKVLSSKSFSSVYSYVQMYRAIVAAAPRIETKGLNPNEGIITKHPDGYWIYVTPSPNEITTGVVVLFGKCKKGRKPDWSIPLITKKCDNDTEYFVSKAFRLNLKAVIAVESFLGAYIGSVSFLLNYGVDVTENPLYTSLFWSYARQMALMADLIYLYYKNVYNVGNFGKFELPKKFKKLNIRDVRVGSIYCRLKENFNNFVKGFDVTYSTEPFKGITDPIFGFKHTGWQSFLAICYLKQIFPKDDGFDSKAIMGGFMRDEMEFRSWYDTSEFNHKMLDRKKSMKISDFYSKLMKNDKEWVNLAYHPDMCFSMFSKLIKDAMNDNPEASPHAKWMKEAAKTGKSTKCNIPIEQSYLYGIDYSYEDSSKVKSKYKGIIPSNLTEALFLEGKCFKRHIEEGFLMTPNSPWYGTEYKLGDKMPSMVELALFEAYVYPEAVVLTMVEKDQTGYDKRAFFVQLIFNRNANKVWDESFRPIVITNKWDMILTPGIEKYMKFGEDMKHIGNRRGHLMVSKDATKFGDTYMIQTFDLEIIAAQGCGYLSTDEAKMLLYFSSCLKKRIVLMPWQNAQSYKKDPSKDYITDKERKWVLEMKKFSDYLDEPDKFKGFVQDTIMNELKDNPSFRKPVGFTLGVFNIAASLQTIAYTELIKMIEDWIGLPPIFHSRTHSDDAHDVTNTKCPDRFMFDEINFEASKVIEGLLKYNRKLYYNNGSFSYPGEKWGDTINVRSEVVSKIHLVLGLFTPRFFSQRPSLLKWGFGVANEVIQVVQFDRQIHVPLIRYSAALGKELPGKSPGSDTYMMSGRIYELLVNGATQECVATTLVAANWLISDMYGIPNDRRKINHPPEIGGLWWSLPGRIYEEGFNSNEVRLQCYRDDYTKRILRYCINVPDIWAKETKGNIEKDKFIIESLSLDDDASNVEGGIEYRKDFLIRLNRKKKTSLGLSKLLDAYHNEVKDAYDRAKASTKTFNNDLEVDDITMMERLKDRWAIEVQAGSKSNIQNLISTASKYTMASTQLNYVRVTPDIKIVARMGYMHRKMSNPFSLSYKDLLLKYTDLNPNVCTVGELWDAVVFLASHEWKLPDSCNKGVTLVHKILGNFIAETNNIIMGTVYDEEYQNIDNLNLQYLKVTDRRELYGVGTYAVKAMAVYYEMALNKDQLPLRNTYVVKNDPKLADNKAFTDQCVMVRAFLQANGYGPLDVLHHFRLLCRLLSETNFRGVAKLPNEYYRFELSTGLLWAYDRRRIYKTAYKSYLPPREVIKPEKVLKGSTAEEDLQSADINNNNNTSTAQKVTNIDNDISSVNDVVVAEQVKETVVRNNVRFDRLVSAIGWGTLVFDDVDMKGDLILNGYKYPVPRPETMLDILVRNEFSNYRANQLLASLLWHHARSDYPLVSVRNKIGKDYYLMLQFGASPNVYMHGKFISETSEWSWSIYCTHMFVEQNPGNYLYIFGKFITYLMVGKGKRLNNIKQLILPKGHKSKFALFGTDISFEDKGSDSWTYLDIKTDVDDKFAKIKPNYGVNKPYGIEFIYTKINKNRNNNTYLVTPWDLGSRSSGLDYHIGGKTVFKDLSSFLICKTHTWYLTYHCGLKEFEVIENCTKLPLDFVFDITRALINQVDLDRYIPINSEDFSQVVLFIREIELYLGVPLSVIILAARKKYKKVYESDKMKAIRKLIASSYSELDLTEDSEINRLRGIGYVCVLSIDLGESFDFVQYEFMKTLSKNAEELCEWDADDGLITGGLDVDLDRRWQRLGNLPISVLRIFLGSNMYLYKVSSFYRESRTICYNAFVTDKIYLLNAVECSKSTEILKLIPFIGFC